MDKIFYASSKPQSCSFKMKRVFMPDNAPSNVSKLTYKFFVGERFTGEKIMN